MSVPATPNHDQPVRELFRHRATRDGRAVVALRGMLMADGSATVEAEVHPPDAASQTKVANTDPGVRKRQCGCATSGPR